MRNFKSSNHIPKSCLKTGISSYTWKYTEVCFVLDCECAQGKSMKWRTFVAQAHQLQGSSRLSECLPRSWGLFPRVVLNLLKIHNTPSQSLFFFFYLAVHTKIINVELLVLEDQKYGLWTPHFLCLWLALIVGIEDRKQGDKGLAVRNRMLWDCCWWTSFACSQEPLDKSAVCGRVDFKPWSSAEFPGLGGTADGCSGVFCVDAWQVWAWRWQQDTSCQQYP